MNDLTGTPYTATFTGLYEPDHSEVIVVACHKHHVVAPMAVIKADAEAIGEGSETLASVPWHAVCDLLTRNVAMDIVQDWASRYGYEAKEWLPETCTH